MKVHVMSHEGTTDWQVLTAWTGAEGQAGWECLHGDWERTERGIRIVKPTKVLAFLADRPSGGFRICIQDVTGSDAVYVEADEYAFDIGGTSAPASRIYQSWGRTVVLAATGHCPRTEKAPHGIVCGRAGGRVEMAVDGHVLLHAEDPAPDQRMVSLTVFLPAGSELTGIQVEGREVDAAHPVRVTSRPGFALDVCVDFLDDMIACAWSREILDAAMALHARNGVRRIHYIYTGGYHDGFYDRRGLNRQRPGVQDRIDQTYAQIGEFFPAFVKAAHTHGMEAVAVFKPFETGMGYTSPLGSEEAKAFGRIPSLGGMLWWTMNFTAAHPYLRMERRTDDVPDDLDQRRIGRIEFIAEPGLRRGFDAGRVQLWVSRDNGRYERREGGFTVRLGEEPSRRVVIDGLELTEHFVAITIEGESRRTFGNLLGALLRVYDTQGRLLPVTIAFGKGRNARFDFRHDGFDMDSAGASCLQDYCWLDEGRPIAFGIGRNRYISGALCPAYPEVQDWWMEQVEACIAAGADAVDFRLHHHNRELDWGAYAFNAPVVRAFQERYGVDIRTDPFDREALRCLQGEFYTGFLRRARRRLRAANKAMHAHLEMRTYPPRWPTYMEIRFPWRQWVEEGLVDEITLKSFRTLRSGVSLKAIDYLRRETEVKINACPYLNDLVRQAHGPALLDFVIRDALAVGVDGFILYENAAILEGRDHGKAEITHPWVVAALTKCARSSVR